MIFYFHIQRNRPKYTILLMPIAECRNYTFCSVLASKQAKQQFHYENMPIQIYLKFYHQKKKEKKMKISNKNIRYMDIFHISVQNIDCGYSLEPPPRDGSNEYPQSMFLSRNKKNNVYPCKPQFYYIKVGFKEVKII